MAMPKTTMDKYNGTILGKVEIRLAREVAGVEPVSEAFPEKRFSYYELRFRVLTTNTGHHSAARFLVDDIDHLPAGYHAPFL